MNYQPLRSFLILAAMMFLLVLGMSSAVFAQGGETVYVTSPAEGESVSGISTVAGAIEFPDFQKYELYLKTGDEMLWAATVYSPVINGSLAFLDTRTFPDGAYQLIVRMVGTDSNYTEFMGPTFFIENELGAPLPYPEMESSPLYPPVAGALARIKNCSGNNLEFDYHSPEGFCSSGNLWITYKDQASPTCPYQDVLLVPCEYRGTAIGQGESRGASYSFVAEAGKIYQLDYPGGDIIYIGEIEGDERASTDTGGLAPDDPARLQPVPASEDTGEVEPAAVEKAPQPTAAPTSAEAVAAPTAAAETSAKADTMLPESGQGTEPKTAFVVAAIGLILLLVVGGAVATRKRGYTA